MSYFIYIIENLINGKRYVGKTTRLEKREREHASGKTNCRLLERAVRKYDWQNFDFCIIEKCKTMDEMNGRESFWIKTLGTLCPGGYNLTEGGEGGGIPSYDTRLKMSRSAKIKIFTPEHRKNIGNAVRGKKNGRYGKPVVGEHRRKLSESHKRENLSEETLLKMSLSHIGHVHSDETKGKISEALSGSKSPRYGIKLSEETKRKIGNSRRQDVCKREHSLTDPENIYTKPNGKRHCRECTRITERLRRQRNKLGGVE